MFEVDDACTLTTEQLYDLGDAIAAQVDPDPPVLTLSEVRVLDT